MVRNYRFLGVMALSAFALIAPLASAKGILVQPANGPNKHDPSIMERCRGAISLVTDVGVEGLRTTAWNFSAVGGGGESGRFDPVPVLQARVTLQQGCLNAHFSAIVGSAAMYGTSPITFFQVTLSQALPGGGFGPPQHMYGHYETPYGIYGPAVMIEAEGDVDTFGANFFQRIGTNPGDVPPGTYLVDVWWAGGPAGAGGAIGAAFVLKLYQ
jgi:hypothetical protein